MNVNLNPSISPLQQGDLDQLCGVYAIINALRLAAGPTRIEKRVEKDLLFRGVRLLLEREILGSTLRHGMGTKKFIKLSRAMVKKASHLTELKFRIKTFCEVEATAEEFLREELLADRPVCARITGSIDHYTVLSGISQTTLDLFDSDGLSWILRSSFCRPVSGSPARYGLDTKALFSIELDDGNQDGPYFDELHMGDPTRLWEIE